MCAIFEFWWNNFFMGMKFNFKFQNWGKFYKGFPCKKIFPGDFFVKWAQIKITGNSFVKFSVGGPRCETTFLWERNSILNTCGELPPDLPTDLPQKGSLIMLKLGPLQVHDIQTCAIFESWWTTFNRNEIKFQTLKFRKCLQRISLQFFFPLEVYVKWIQIRIKENSFVKFSDSGPRCETFLWERNSNLNFLSEVPL